MIIHLKEVINKDELQSMRTILDSPGTPWIEGKKTAGTQAQLVKNNEQLQSGSEQAKRLRKIVLDALKRNPIFFAAALPKKIFNPMFNRYRPEAPTYGPHIDGAILYSHDDSFWVRGDISCTLFLSDPDEYDGGELIVHDVSGINRLKLPAGDAILYPGGSLHSVSPVVRGVRLASFFWIESMVRNVEQRKILFELDKNILSLRSAMGECEQTVALTGIYHNLLRLWGDTL